MTKEIYVQCDFCIMTSVVTFVTDWNEEISSCRNHKQIAKHLAEGGEF